MFRFRAIRKSSNNNKNLWYLFKLDDCPVLLWDDTFILSGKENTPVMMYDTVVRGHPKKNIFEGDYIFDKTTNEVLGIVVYNNGFFMQKNSNSVKKQIPFGHIYIGKGDKESVKILNSLERTPISFKYLNTEFNLKDLVFVDSNLLDIIITKKHKKINLKGVTSLIYYTTKNQFYEGDMFKGSFLTLDNINLIEELQIKNEGV